MKQITDNKKHWERQKKTRTNDRTLTTKMKK